MSIGKDEFLPLVIATSGGRVGDVGLMNKKGYKKSIESNSLWVIVPETTRLLPYHEKHTLISLDFKGKWYQAVVEGMDAEVSSPGSSSAFNTPPALPDTLAALRAVVHKRRLNLPEGSYTSYLFKEGAEKIRKKLGEEAIELILARDKDDIIFEAADLIYHLLVLLESADIPLEEVFAELAGRAG